MVVLELGAGFKGRMRRRAVGRRRWDGKRGQVVLLNGTLEQNNENPTHHLDVHRLHFLLWLKAAK